MIHKIALAQMAPSSDVGDTLKTHCSLAAQAKQLGCTAVCFPEASLTGYLPEEAARCAIGADSPAIGQLSAAAQSLGIDLLVGYMEKGGGQYYLTHTLLRPDGTRHDYRKTHLGEKEARFFAAGDRLDVFFLSCGLKAGFQLCVETHFPEITQTLSLRGAQVVFAPHAVPHDPQRRRKLWQTYIPARAYDNRVYAACCNLSGGRFGGGCYAVDPRGEAAAEYFERGEALCVFEADCALLDRLRGGEDGMSARYYPRLRKPKMYL